MSACVLAINGGSSSIKFAVYGLGPSPGKQFSGQIERIGLAGSKLSAQATDGSQPESAAIEAKTHEQAVGHLLDWLEQRVGQGSIKAVGHRIVHGGPKYFEPCLVDPELVAELKRLSPLDPAHLPGEIGLIEAFSQKHPRLPQVACFDTAFHHNLPRVACLLPIPRSYEAQGVRRYGFHGLSYCYLMEELTRVAGPEAAAGRIVLAHLGSGASMAAVAGGKCIDTTMSFTPTAGLVMGTRTGDLDPGVLIYLLRNAGLGADELDDLVNRRSGLAGISETSSDVRDLLARESSDARAAEAIAIFCYQASKWVGALAAALGGLDTLVFSGGIGEHAAEVRARICKNLGFLGIALDEARNAASQAVISRDGADCTVRVIPTDEEAMIVRLVERELGESIKA